MKISIALATYNGSKYLSEQLDSIYAQSYKPDEVIICDDCSSDDTVKIINSFISSHNLSPNWRLYLNKKNLGYANNFYEVLNKTSGDFILFSDQDDVWKPDKIKETIIIMSSHPEIKLLCTDYDILKSSKKTPTIHSRHSLNPPILEKINLSYKNIFIGSLGCVMCITRAFANSISSYWYPGWAHDEYVWKLAQCMDGCYIYHKKLIYHRLHSSNCSMKPLHSISLREKYLEDLICSHKATLQCALDQQLTEKKINIIRRNIIAAQLRLELFKKHRWFNIIRLLSYTNCYHSKRSILMEPYLLIKNK